MITDGSDFDLHRALAVAEDCARRAGALLRKIAKRPIRAAFKGAVDLVTRADRESEALITGGLLAAFPDHHIVGEESGGAGAPREAAKYRWYVDPLDGTTNYAHHIPHYCVSIALAGPDDLPRIGVVYDPTLDECFKAVRGGGATLNGKPIRVSKVKRLDKALLAAGFPNDRRETADNNTEEFMHMTTRCLGTRCLGAAALDISYVAAGRLEGFWEPRINPWDAMAGLLIVVEAGGRASNFRGTTDGVFQGKQVAATNGLIHDEMLTVILLGRDAPHPRR